MSYRLQLGVLGLSALGLTFAVLGGSAHAANPEHVAQLLTTGDCPECDLSGVALKDLALQDANLRGANLSESYLQTVDLTRANLAGANLSGTRLNSTNLTGANLQNADLSGASSPFFCDTDFDSNSQDQESCVTEFLPFQILAELCVENVDLAEVIAEAAFGEATDACTQETIDVVSQYAVHTAALQRLSRPLVLRGANLSGANLQEANFSGADFSYATLSGTEASGADFSYARIFHTDVAGFNDADLTHAWDSWESVGEWMMAAKERSEERAASSEGRIYIGVMSRVQQAHYLEEGRFTTAPFAFGLGFGEETESYRYGAIAPAVAETGLPLARGIVQYALSKKDILPSFLNVVYVEVDADSGEATTYGTLCESETTGLLSIDNVPTVTAFDDLATCPAGWKVMP